MQVSVNVLIWNDLKYLPDLFASVAAQTYTDLVIRVLDNGSTDGSLEYLQKHHPQYLVARNVRNLGFATGHNQLIRFALERWGNEELATKAVLWVNADMILHPNLISELVQALETDEKLGAAQPKLLRAFSANPENGLDEKVLSDVLDTTGLVLKKTWRMEDRGAGEVDKGQYNNALDIIGPSGTCALLRASALKSVANGEEFFDDDFFAYREDCDLALRLRRGGWLTKFVPQATAHHYRGMYGAANRSWLQRFLDRRKQRPMPAAFSTRNQLYFLLKNLTLGDAWRFGPLIVINELSRVCYGLAFEPETRRQLFKGLKLVGKMWSKRRYQLSKATVSEQVIRAYVKA